jgi:integrase
MYLVEPTGRKRKWDIRIRLPNGKTVRIPGDRDESIAEQIGQRLEMLAKAKANGDPPPSFLGQWIASMDIRLAARLVSLGLIPAKNLEHSKTLIEQIDEWEGIVQGRHPDSSGHACQQAFKVRRIVKAITATTLSDLDADRVVEKVNGFQTDGCKVKTPLATSTRRSYEIAAKDFTSWLSKRLKADDPLLEMELPGQYSNVEYERQPLTVKQFQALTTYLNTFERYPNQKSRWSAKERQLIYWTAVKTGYRESELKKLRKWNLYLDGKPAVVGLKARHNKNKQKGEVPIPNDLAAALKKHIANLEPDDLVFRFPSTSGSVVDMLRKDLEGAGISWKLVSGELIDFHALRATAIVWWLTVDRRTPKEVQVLARLKSISMLDKYTRNFKLEDFRWLNRGPNLMPVNPRRAG